MVDTSLGLIAAKSWACFGWQAPLVHSIQLDRDAGEYLKTKRSLIRADEKLASMSEKIEQLKQALHKAGVDNSTDSPSARSDTSTQPFGTPKSVQAGTPKAFP